MRYLPFEIALVAALMLLVASPSVAFPPERIPAAPARSPRGAASGPDGKLVKPPVTKTSMLSRISRWFGASKTRPPASPRPQPGYAAGQAVVAPGGIGRLTSPAQPQSIGEGQQMTAYEFWVMERDERNPR